MSAGIDGTGRRQVLLDLIGHETGVCDLCGAPVNESNLSGWDEDGHVYCTAHGSLVIAIKDQPRRAAYIAASERGGWRPIETAPTTGWDKDGGPEILGIDERGRQQVTFAFDVGDEHGAMGWDDPLERDWFPTRWQPLPAAPDALPPPPAEAPNPSQDEDLARDDLLNQRATAEAALEAAESFIANEVEARSHGGDEDYLKEATSPLKQVRRALDVIRGESV